MLFRLFFFSVFLVQSQSIVTELNYNLTVTFVPEITNIRKTTLIVGDNYSHYSVDYSPKSKGELDKNTELIVIEEVNKKEYFSEILLENENSILIENRFDRRGIKKFLSIEEKTPNMVWDIKQVKKEISGYNCNLAKVKFRGRNYTAYFTNEIPINMGPWKFNGLPGLIVAIYDEAGIYKWELETIKKVSHSKLKKRIEDFNFKRRKFLNVTYEEFDRKRINYNISKLKVAKSRQGSRKYKSIYSFSTEQWLEPSNEYRSETYFSY